MEWQILGAPSFAYIKMKLAPGDELTAESGAMSSMDPALGIKAKLNGRFLTALARRFLGGESFFVNRFSNASTAPAEVTLVASTPGDIKELSLNGNAICLQPGALVAWTNGIRISTRWAGLVSWISGEGLFKLIAHGQGTIWIGAYGAIFFKDIAGEEIVDSSHLVAYEPHVKLKLRLAGGIFSSFFGGEGLVTRVIGPGKIAIQTRSVSALAGWVNPHFLD